MNIRLIAAVFGTCLLGGCTNADWDRTMTYVGLGSGAQNEQNEQAGTSDAAVVEAPPAAPAPQPEAPVAMAAAPQAEAPAEAVPAPQPETPVAAAELSPAEQWCREIARTARDDAASEGFDATTQKLRADRTYRQCVEFPGSSMR